MEDKITYKNIQFYKIKDFKDYYISKCGKVYSDKNKKILKQYIDKQGYCIVYLYRNKRHFKSVHRLVAQTFIFNIKNKKTVNHKDFNKSNNRISNLEWNTQKENNKHYRDNNRHYVLSGKNHIQSIKVSQYDLNGNLIKIWDSFGTAASSLNISQGNMWSVCNNKRNKCGGFKWRYAE
jgi:hypothetical protein